MFCQMKYAPIMFLHRTPAQDALAFRNREPRPFAATDHDGSGTALMERPTSASAWPAALPKTNTVRPIHRGLLLQERQGHCEVDGGQHGQPDRRSRDEARDLWLAAQGYLTLRFTNAEVFTALELVKETIFWRCYERLPDGHPVKLP